MLAQAEQFEEKYRPIKNHLHSDAPFNGCLFETHGSENNFVQLQDYHKVWTVVDYDGVIYYQAGIRLFNRIGYLVTEVPWENSDEEIRVEIEVETP